MQNRTFDSEIDHVLDRVLEYRLGQRRDWKTVEAFQADELKELIERII